MHVLIEEYLNSSERLSELIKKHLPSKEPLITALNLLMQSDRASEAEIKVSIQFAEKINIKKSDKLLASLFLFIWAIQSKSLKRDDEVSSLLNLSSSMFTKQTPSLFKTLHKIISIDRSQLVCLEDFFKAEALAILPFSNKSIRQLKIAGSHFIVSAKYGMLINNEKLFLKLFKTDKYLINLVMSINYFEIGDLAMCEKIMKKLGDKKEPIRTNFSILDNVVYLNEALELFKKKDQYVVDRLVDSNLDENLKNHLMSIYYLFIKENKESLLIIGNKKIGNSSFLMAGFIRANLANRKIEKSFQLLSENYKNWQFHYFDHFYWSRLELLRGEKEKAVQHFAKLLQKCDHYKSEGRLDIELELATELSPGDIRFLVKEATLLNMRGKNISLPKIPVPKAKKTVGVNKILGKSKEMVVIKKTIRSYADIDMPILITGETGVGKEVISKAIHEESKRKHEPFLGINCGAIADTLLQSELFGHKEGSYTGATKKHIGLFEMAGKGTLLLDEIGEISPKLQVSLLRVLETKEIRPVGSAKAKPFHCRVLAATNANLEQMVEEGLFRQDLLFRLKGLEIKIPPLRMRTDDVLLLAEHYFSMSRLDGKKPRFTSELQEAFVAYSWPGNIRELKNEIEKMQHLNSENEVYDMEDCDLFHEKVVAKKDDRRVESKADTEVKVGEQVESSDRMRKYSRLPAFRRLEAIKKAFEEHGVLTRSELASMFDISRETASIDLNKLIKIGFVKKVKPTPSPRTFYFEINR